MEINSMNAYMFWIAVDCFAIKPKDAFEKYSREKWWVGSNNWVFTIILNQDQDGLTALRDEYTKKTGEDWRSAKLSNVKKL